jgi:GMP synthase (glutamine-hydrolysing)
MILLINICKEKLHYFEFVKPIEDILRKDKISFFVKNYQEIQQKDLKKAEKVIICGASLFDNEFSLIENLKFFKWIEDFNKPIFGICGGMQVISRIFGARIKKETEIGFFREKFRKSFLSLDGEVEVYHLHNYYSDFSNKKFEIFSLGKISQAVKHNEKEIYGVLFHPEVRNKNLIQEFLKL